MLNKDEIYYSLGGIPQYFDSLTEFFDYRVTNTIETIKINTSSQPNNIPHLGTVTTLASAFAIAKLIKEKFPNKNVEVEFDEIECCSMSKEDIDGKKYVKAISDINGDSGLSIAEENMEYYKEIFTSFSKKTNISPSIRTYEDFQANKFIRDGLIKVVNDMDFFVMLLNPKDKKLHIRTKCPQCRRIDKDRIDTRIKEITPEGFVVESFCDEHGKFDIPISTEGNSFIEMNTQLRDLLKGVLIAEDERNGILTAMVDGSDWSGTWATRIHCEAVQHLEKRIPIRLFSPLILDRSGGKLSKSTSLCGKKYSYVDKAYDNYLSFKEKFGEKGIDILYNEVTNWVVEPKKFFRSYSIDYIVMIMTEKMGVMHENQHY
jgi:hypothetical protein